MSAPTLARQIYQEEARRLEGLRAHDLSEALLVRARSLRLHDMQTETHESARDVLDGLEPQGSSEGDLSVAATHLERASRDIEETVGKTNALNLRLPEGVAGQARLGATGSDSFDARSLEGEEGVVDVEMAKGLAAHEQFHTEQSEPDAEEVTLGTGEKIMAHDFIEAGAIAAQEKVAPGSIRKLSLGYQALYAKVCRFGSKNRVEELSRKGELRRFASEITAQAA